MYRVRHRLYLFIMNVKDKSLDYYTENQIYNNTNNWEDKLTSIQLQCAPDH